jgi:predicted transcriptional regulator
MVGNMTYDPGNSILHPKILRLTTQIVVAYVRNNSIAISKIPAVIEFVYKTLSGLDDVDQAAANAKQKPAVPIEKSVTANYLICLEDGQKLKMLKRHLRTFYGLRPEDYRAKWGLSPDYPMVAPNYAKRRSDFAKQFGLGKRRA